jgi:hypothetical protein
LLTAIKYVSSDSAARETNWRNILDNSFLHCDSFILGSSCVSEFLLIWRTFASIVHLFSMYCSGIFYIVNIKYLQRMSSGLGLQ